MCKDGKLQPTLMRHPICFAVAVAVFSSVTLLPARGTPPHKLAVDEKGCYPSPDGQIQVRYVPGDSGWGDRFQIEARLVGVHRTAKVLYRLRDFRTVNGLVWVPKHTRMLVFAVNYSGGPQKIFQWRNGNITTVFKGRLADDEDSDAEYLILRGVSSDGSHLYYSYLQYRFDKNGNALDKPGVEQKLPVLSLSLCR